jgi:uncharacterized protein (TIGR03437 family)
LASAPQAGSTSSIVYAGGTYPISIAKMAVDGGGNAYVIGNWLVTGAMYIPYLPLPPAIALSDIVVSKIDPSGGIAYVTHIGGKGNDTALGIAVDSSGNVYGAGYTTSQDFPLRHATQSIPGSPSTGFVFKLDSNGDLAWSTYFGGSGLGLLGGSVNAVAVDGAGNAYVTGISDQANLTTTAGAFQTTAIVRGNVLGPASSAFVAKFSPLGTLVYSTWLGGSAPNCVGGSGCVGYTRTDDGLAIAVDGGGNAYVTGTTNSTDFPVTPGAFQTGCACPPHTTNDFVTKLNPAGAKPVYSTYLRQGTGYSGHNSPRSGAITVDSGGKAYVALPAVGPDSPALPQSFVAALNPAGSALAFSTYVGGTSPGGTSSIPTGIALDAAGDVFLSGTTHDATFPDSLTAFPTGPNFVMELSPGVTKVLFSARLPVGTVDADVAIDPATGNVVTAGSSGYLMRLSNLSSPLPPVLGVGNAANGSIDQAVTPMEILSIYGIGIGPKTPVTARPSAGTYPTTLGGVQVFFNHRPAPLLYVSANLINTVVSDNPETYFGPEIVDVVLNGAQIAELTVPLTANMPGIFINPDGSAIAVNQDGTLNSRTNPAKDGSTVSIFGTGVASLLQFEQQPTVQLQSSPQASYQLTYAGPAPHLITGAFQISFKVSQVSGNQLPIQLLAGGIQNPFTVFVYVTP